MKATPVSLTINYLPAIMNGHDVLSSLLLPNPVEHIISILLLFSLIGGTKVSTDVILLSVLSTIDALYISIVLYCKLGLTGTSSNSSCILESVSGTIHVM